MRYSFFKNIKKRQSGQAMIISVIFFIFISLATTLGLVSSSVREFRVTGENLVYAKRILNMTDVAIEDILYRSKMSYNHNNNEFIMISSNSADTDIVSTGSSKKVLDSTGYAWPLYRHIQSELNSGISGRFVYGMLTGAGGLSIQDSASISSNVYSNGPVSGIASNLISGDVISSGASGSITSVHATGNGYANTISSSTIDGTSFTGAPQQPTVSMPITDANITTLETEASGGGSVTCTGGKYTISANETIGPKRVPCDLEITGGTVTLSGHLWVEGNVTISGSASLVVGGALSNESVAIVARKPTDTLTGSKITISNTGSYTGIGNTSFVVLISQNNSAESAGAENAITVSGNVTGDLMLYAPHGNISISASPTIRKIAGYKVTATGSASINLSTTFQLALLPVSGSSWNMKYWKEVE